MASIPKRGAVPNPDVLLERRGHIAVITLNRPAAMNAVNAALSQALGDAMAELARDRHPSRLGTAAALPHCEFVAGLSLAAYQELTEAVAHA